MEQLAAQIRVERHVVANKELGIPRFRVTNGPVGVGMGDGTPSPPATALPMTIALAAGFDRGLAAEYGDIIGEEAAALGQHVLEGPGVFLPAPAVAVRNFGSVPLRRHGRGGRRGRHARAVPAAVRDWSRMGRTSPSTSGRPARTSITVPPWSCPRTGDSVCEPFDPTTGALRRARVTSDVSVLSQACSFRPSLAPWSRARPWRQRPSRSCRCPGWVAGRVRRTASG